MMSLGKKKTLKFQHLAQSAKFEQKIEAGKMNEFLDSDYSIYFPKSGIHFQPMPSSSYGYPTEIAPF